MSPLRLYHIYDQCGHRRLTVEYYQLLIQLASVTNTVQRRSHCNPATCHVSLQCHAVLRLGCADFPSIIPLSYLLPSRTVHHPSTGLRCCTCTELPSHPITSLHCCRSLPRSIPASLPVVVHQSVMAMAGSELVMLLAAGVLTAYQAKHEVDKKKEQQSVDDQKSAEITELRAMIARMAQAQEQLQTQQQQQQQQPPPPAVTIETVKEVESPALLAKLDEYKASTADLRQRLDTLTSTMADNKIDTIDQLEKQDKKAFNRLVELAEEATPVPMEGNHIGVLGVVSSGQAPGRTHHSLTHSTHAPSFPSQTY